MQEIFEKIIKKLNERFEHYDIRNKILTDAGMFSGADRMAERMIEIDFAREIIKQAAAEYNNGWIPCSEKLPKSNGVYQVTHKVRECEYTYYLTSASYFDGQDTWHNDVCVNHARRYLDVVAWIPLPEPYKEGE